MEGRRRRNRRRLVGRRGLRMKANWKLFIQTEKNRRQKSSRKNTLNNFLLEIQQLSLASRCIPDHLLLVGTLLILPRLVLGEEVQRRTIWRGWLFGWFVSKQASKQGGKPLHRQLTSRETTLLVVLCGGCCCHSRVFLSVPASTMSERQTLPADMFQR